MSTLLALIQDDDHFHDALAIFKVAVDKGEKPVEALRKAMLYFAMLHEPGPAAVDRWSHDQRIANNNRLFRDEVVPSLAKSDGAILISFDRSGDGLLTYISNCERSDCAAMLRKLGKHLETSV